MIAWRNRRDPKQPWRAPLALVALVIFQGLLGMWTVTLLLKPIVVVGHLLGGFATLALLVSLGQLAHGAVPARRRSACARSGVAAAAALVLQISLGGWTSANYAALACPDFPTCQTQWWPAIADFERRLRAVARPRHRLRGRRARPSRARGAVHFTHRLGRRPRSRA